MTRAIARTVACKTTNPGRTKAVTSEGPQARSATDARRAYVPIKSRDRMSRGALQKKAKMSPPERMENRFHAKAVGAVA